MDENKRKIAKKDKKKKSYILYIIIAVVVIALTFVGTVAYINRNNIKALYGARKSSKEEIRIKQEKNQQRTEEILNSLTNADIKELPDEIREKLRTGEISEEESLDIILGNVTAHEIMEKHNLDGKKEGEVKPSNAVNPTDDKPLGEEPKESKPEPQKPQEEGNNNHATKEQIIAKIYLLRAEYLNKIEAFIESGKATISAIPIEEWTTSKKMSLINQFAEQGKALEASCDARMEKLLGELEAELIRLGESTDPIGEIRNSYKEQKQLKKEELFNLYYPD